MDANKYAQLTESQRKAVFHIDGPLLILAGPGSGKTRVITYRIAALIDSGINPYHICAITFTNKAAEQMRQRTEDMISRQGFHISTFHSLCVRLLRQYNSFASLKPNFSIYDVPEQTKCIKQAIAASQVDTTNFTPGKLLNIISTLKNRSIEPEEFAADAQDFFSKIVSKIYTGYQQILQADNAVDFDDLLMKTSIMLRNSEEVRAEVSKRFKYLLIDEYQDTNQSQYQIAKAIASGHGNICVTGDPDQSIYKWRGADISNILMFEEDWPTALVVKLEENFRSTAKILKAADDLIVNNKKRKSKVLIPTKDQGSDVVVEGFEDEFAEARAVAEKIKKLAAEKTSLRDIAICYRVNSMSRVLEEAMIAEQLPYQIVRGVEFYRRKEIRDLLAYLKILVNPDDEVSLLRVINTPARGIGKTTIEKIKLYAQQNMISFYQAIKTVSRIETLNQSTKAKIAKFVGMIEQFKKQLDIPLAELIKKVFEETGLEKTFVADKSSETSERDNINELINAAALYDKSVEQSSLIDYLQQISLFSDADAYDASQDRVALMTLHAAKGLEFENIFIVGLEEGLLPHERSTDTNDTDDLEEERRLFFVGITRAKSDLNISFARYRTTRGQLQRTIPSQFLCELGIDFQANPQPEYTFQTSLDSDISFERLKVPQFVNGQLVRHPKFGLGRVQEFNDIGENSTIVVKFDIGQTKTLMLQYAKLTKIDAF